jgi:hypothetical protein
LPRSKRLPTSRLPTTSLRNQPNAQPDFSLLDKPAAARRPRRPHRLRLPRGRRSRLRSTPRAPAAIAASRRHRNRHGAYKPPEPDVSIKYQVLLGLPPDLSPLPPAPAQARNKGDDNFDAPAIDAPISRAR